MILFWNTVSDITGIELQREHIRQAAILTFVNVVILSLIFSLIDIVRRRIMVDKPVKRIVDAAERIMQGDLSVRIEKASSADPCLLGFENIWEDKEIEISTQIQDSVMITADPELLSLVWNNLFSNAFKFTGSGGKVSVTLEADEIYAAVKVSDTGCGIKREVGEHIFEKFYQGDRSHAAKGNGLGLALVKRVVDITGGEISVESEVGKGSAFTVKLRRRYDYTLD